MSNDSKIIITTTDSMPQKVFFNDVPVPNYITDFVTSYEITQYNTRNDYFNSLSFLDGLQSGYYVITEDLSDPMMRTYSDAVEIGSFLKAPVKATTTANLVATRVSNVLTADANGVLTLDTVTLIVGDRVLIKNQSTGADNGIYTVTNIGDGSNPFVLTRSTDVDTSPESVFGVFTYVIEGDTYADTGWILSTSNPITLNTTALTFTQFLNLNLDMVVAGSGLVRTVNTMKIVSANTGIVVNNSDIALTLASNSGLEISSGLKLASSITLSSLTSDTITVSKAIGSVSTDGVVLVNPSSATAGNQKISPRIRLTGRGWKTNATAGSQIVDWAIENRPVQGATSPSSILAFMSQINGGGYVDKFTLTSTGDATFVGTVTSAGGGGGGAVTFDLDVKTSVRVSTTANLVATRVSNVLTADANGSINGSGIDGVTTLVVGDRILVKNQSTGADNGIYEITDLGDGSNPFVLTRTIDADNSPSGEVTSGMYTFVTEGTVNADIGWLMTTDDPIVLNTTSLVFTQFTSGGTSFANPTGTIGLTANNGVAITAMRSDATPALSQAIVPVWTSTHIFSHSTGLVAKNAIIGGTDDSSSYHRLTVLQNSTGIGTVSNGASGTTVTGVGTLFLDTFKVGQTITINGETKTISAIASNTSMTTSAITGANSGVAYLVPHADSHFIVKGNGDLTLGSTSSSVWRVGSSHFVHQTGGSNNLFMGLSSGSLSVGTGAISNTGYGSATLSALTSGDNNVAIGASALQQVSSGGNNTAVGKSAGFSVGSTSNNSFFGYTAGSNNSGSDNVSIGADTLGGLGSGSQNVAVGSLSLQGNSTGSGNIAIGYNAGSTFSTLSFAITTGSNNTFIGYASGLASATQRTKSVGIGYYARVDSSYAATIGGIGVDSVYFGLDTTNPLYKFSVTQSPMASGTVSNGAGGTTVTGVDTRFLDSFKIGDSISLGTQTVLISAIASNTSMTTSAITNANTNTTYTIINPENTVAGTGTVSNLLNGFTVTGVGTSFLTEININDSITINGESRQVVSIASDTSLTTASVFQVANTTQAFNIQKPVLRFAVKGSGDVNISSTGRTTTVNGSLTVVGTVTSPNIFSWSEVIGTSQTIVINRGYISNNASLVTFTLPVSASVGDVFKITGKGAGGWKIAQNANGIIHFGNLDTTTGVGGYLESTHRRDSIELVCVTQNNEWNVISSVGSITIV